MQSYIMRMKRSCIKIIGMLFKRYTPTICQSAESNKIRPPRLHSQYQWGNLACTPVIVQIS